MTKTMTIKRIIGKPLKEEGFVYVGYDRDGPSWMFKREKKERTDWIYIENSRYWNEIWIDIQIIRVGKKSGDRLYGIEAFYPEIPSYEIKGHYSDQKTFESALEKLLHQIQKYFLPGFEDIAHIEIEWEMTSEVYQAFYDRKDELLEAFSQKYDLINITEDKLSSFLENVFKEYQDRPLQEVQETLSGLAVFWGNFMVRNLEECWWDWLKRDGKNFKYCIFYRVRYNRPHGTEITNIDPLQIISNAWREKTDPCFQDYYNKFFVTRRKYRKALHSWNIREENKLAESTDEDEWKTTRMSLTPFIERYGFRYDFYHDKEKGYLCYRGKDENRQEIWVMRNKDTGEMWVRVVGKCGRKLEIQDIREGMAPYGRAEFCGYSVRQSTKGRFIDVLCKMEKQIAEIWIPVLDSIEDYLLKWELTPEMEKREFYERDRLLEKLKGNYVVENISKEELPSFIKRVLKENEDSTMEEFGDTLLGLGVLLGETAIKEIEGSHWLWDKGRAACLITYRNEVTGIDPAFSLNYAWQKRKPENVDKLWQDLMEGNYIEDRERGGYDIEEDE